MLPNLVESKGLTFDQLSPVNKALTIVESTQLTVSQNIVTVNPDTTPIVITLPPVGDCAGRLFAITVNAGGTAGTVTIKDKGDSIQWTDIAVADETDGGALLWCDGAKFWVLNSVIA